MKRTAQLFLLCLLTLTGFAQEPEQEIGLLPTDNFYQICAKADLFFAQEHAGPVANDRVAPPFSDDEYRAYQRWKWYWQSRVDEQGNFPDLVAMKAESDAINNNQRSMMSGTWTSISQTSTTGGYNGMGRTTCVAFDPTNANVFYVGAPIGGLWKTSDGGQSWTALTDGLPYVSVGSCLVDPTNANTIYISVGDHIGWWNRSLGIYKSTDGGSTWNPTGLSWNLTQGYAISGMVMDPTNSQIIYAATSNGLYKTTNGGATWAVARAGYYSDVEMEPGTANVYAALHDYWGSSEVFRSIDGGTTWSQLTTFATNYNWIRLAVTPANAAKLAIQCSSGTHPLYVSTNYGSNLNYIADCPEDAILYISPTNANVMYCGYLFIHQSTDGGATWNQLTYWYYNPPYQEVHADQHNVTFNPLNPDVLYFCNDGGMYTYSESNTNWNNLSNGLVITQFYKIAVSQLDPMMMLGGTQDNGGRLRNANGSWRASNGGDAMEVAIDNTNDNVIYTTYVNGQLYRSLDRWVNDTYYEISANIPGGLPNGSWVTPYTLDPSNHNTLVAGYDDVWRTTDRGANWTQLSTNITGTGATLECLEVAPSDPNTIYTSRGNVLYRTTNLGGTWSNVTLPGTVGITSIAVHPTNSQELWVTRGGYTASAKVYHSTNGGTTWTNISTGLPNSPVNTSVFEIGSANLIYVGTDAGIYYRDTLTNTWQGLNNGLPFTSVTDLQIYYPTRKLRAATFGRGIWENDLSDPLGVTTTATVQQNTLTLYPNPANGLTQLTYASNSNEAIQVVVTNVLGERLIVFNEQGTQQLNKQLDLSGLAVGYYLVKVQQGETLTTQRLIVR